MINKIPIFGWMLSAIANTSLAIPFWICWTVCNIGEIYFEFLPTAWHSIPFWDCVGLFVSLSIVKTFVPKVASVHNDNDNSIKSQ